MEIKNGCGSLAQEIKAAGGGDIINISTEFLPRRAAYCSSKAAVNLLTKVLAIEWADRNISVNAIAPDISPTDLVQDVINKMAFPMDAIKKRTPRGWG